MTGATLAALPTGLLAGLVAPVPDRGLFISIFQQSWSVSNTAGPLVIGWLLSVGVGWLWAFMTVALIVGGASFLLSGIGLPDAVNRPVRHNVPTERSGQVTNG